jgi:hypothetical protein
MALAGSRSRLWDRPSTFDVLRGGWVLLLVDPRRHVLCAFVSAQSWNLVGAEWWRKWCDYVGMDPKNGSPYGSLPVPQIPPNTLVEAALNIRGNIATRAASFSTDAGGNRPPRPGPIANWGLLMQSGCRRLKEKLVLAHDFYVSDLGCVAAANRVLRDFVSCL